MFAAFNMFVIRPENRSWRKWQNKNRLLRRRRRGQKSPGQADKRSIEKMKIVRLAEEVQEFSTNVVLKVGEQYVSRHENGGNRGSHEVGGRIPELLQPDQFLTPEQAALKCLEYGAPEKIIEAII
jgi:hypothetical protein